MLIQQDQEALTLNPVGTPRPPVPWQLWVVGAVLVTYLTFLAVIMLPILGNTIAAVAEVFSSQEAAKTKLQAGLVLLGCLVLACLLTVCMLSIPALYRGKQWGLFIAFGIVIVNVAILILGAIGLMRAPAPMNGFLVAVGVSVLGSFAGMLLAPSVLHYFTLQQLGRTRVVLSGTLCGAAAASLLWAACYGVAEIGVWMRHDQGAGSPAAATKKP